MLGESRQATFLSGSMFESDGLGEADRAEPENKAVKPVSSSSPIFRSGVDIDLG